MVSNDGLECQFDKAINAFHQSHYGKAINLFNRCVNKQKHSEKSHFYMGISYRNMNEFELSAFHLKKIIPIGNINYYLEYAFSLERSGDIRQALDIYTKAASEHTLSIGANLGQARMNHWLGNINESIVLYKNLDNKHPDNIGIKLGYAFALMSDRRLKESGELFNWVLGIEQDNVSAKEGIRMLSNMNNHELTISSEYISFDVKSTKAQRIEYISTPDYSLKWGVGLIHYENPISFIFQNGINTNRPITDDASIFMIYKINEKNEVLVRYTQQGLFGSNALHKIKLEDYITFNNKSQLSLGLTQSYSNSEVINTLTNIGISIKRNNKLELNGQFFYSKDKYFSDSQSISLGVVKTTKNNSLFQFGGSLNKTDLRKSTTLFGKVRFKVYKNFNIETSITKNSKDKYTQVSIGVRYEF